MFEPTGSDGAHRGAISVSPLRAGARTQVGRDTAEAPQPAPSAPGSLPPAHEARDLAALPPADFLELIATIRAKHGPLSLSGLRQPDEGEDWLAHLAGFHRAAAFLSLCQVRKSKARWPHSYSLKHMAEVLPPHTYVANGVLIAAAIELELPWLNAALKYGHGQNAEIGVIVPKPLQSLEPPIIVGGVPESWQPHPCGAAAAHENTPNPNFPSGGEK